jgi:hypothetical protein
VEEEEVVEEEEERDASAEATDEVGEKEAAGEKAGG